MDTIYGSTLEHLPGRDCFRQKRMHLHPAANTVHNNKFWLAPRLKRTSNLQKGSEKENTRGSHTAKPDTVTRTFQRHGLGTMPVLVVRISVT